MKLKTLLFATAIVLTPVVATAGSGHHTGGTDADMAKMEAHMQSMEKEMAQIRAIKDPAARRTALQKHMQGMVGMMDNMMDHSGQAAGSSTDAQIAYLTKRIDMVQAMMNQMIQSRAATYGVFPSGMDNLLSEDEYKEN